MKTFKLSIFKGANTLIVQKLVKVASKEELKYQKNGFWSEFPSHRKNPKNWMGVERIK
jgi:hypothetical protein